MAGKIAVSNAFRTGKKEIDETAATADNDVTFKKKLGAKLERLRKAKGLTRQELAAATDIPLSTYGSYAQGIREPDLQRLQRLARVLGVTINDLAEH